MDLQKLSNSRKSMVGIPLIFLLCMFMIVYSTQRKRMSPDLDEFAIYRRSSFDDSSFIQNDTMMELPCNNELALHNSTVQEIVSKLQSVTDDYVSLVRISIAFIDDNLPVNSEQSNPSVWHWGLGGRGRTFLHFPYVNKSLSLNTLSFGFHWVNVTIDNTGAPNESYSDACVGFTLSKVLRQVRRQLTNIGGALRDARDDVLCKERYLSLPFFRATLIPGYSLFDLQSSSYYECWKIKNIETCDQDNCVEYPSFTIEGTIVTISFGITYILLLLALIWELWRIYSRDFDTQQDSIEQKEQDGNKNSTNQEEPKENETPITQGGNENSIEQNEQKGNKTSTKQKKQEKLFNILRINLIPPVLLMLANTDEHDEQDHPLVKKVNRVYWSLVYAIPIVIYLVFFLIYITTSEFAFRSSQRGEKFQQAHVWGLDFGLANICYLIGAIIFIYFQVTKGQDNHGESKKVKIQYYSAVAIFCFFRFSATAMLLVEIIVLTSIGIAINIRYGSPVWINIILGAFFVVANIIEFFDSYQHLFSKIHSVGTKVEQDNPKKKIIKKNRDGSQQLIDSVLLCKIIQEYMPLYSHIFNTIKHIIIGIVFLGIVALIVFVIDRTTQISSFVEYVVTALPLVIAAAGRLGGSPLTAGGKAKNSTKDKLLTLEKDLRDYANNKGKFVKTEDNAAAASSASATPPASTNPQVLAGDVSLPPASSSTNLSSTVELTNTTTNRR